MVLVTLCSVRTSNFYTGAKKIFQDLANLLRVIIIKVDLKLTLLDEVNVKERVRQFLLLAYLMPLGITLFGLKSAI